MNILMEAICSAFWKSSLLSGETIFYYLLQRKIYQNDFFFFFFKSTFEGEGN